MADSDKIKNVQILLASGSVSVSISPYEADYCTREFVLTLVSGIPTTIKAGSSVGGGDILAEIDISYLQVGVPFAISVLNIPDDDTIYFTIGAGVMDINTTLAQYQGA